MLFAFEDICVPSRFGFSSIAPHHGRCVIQQALKSTRRHSYTLDIHFPIDHVGRAASEA
jgi:hypothetical protein